MVSNKFFYSPSFIDFVSFPSYFILLLYFFILISIEIFFCCIIIRLHLIAFDSIQSAKSTKQTSYEIILIASTRVLARLRARFASIVCLLPSALLKFASAISRVC